MNEDLTELLTFASIDKGLSSNEFRLLFFIATNDIISNDIIIDKLGIKTGNTISNCINNLLELKYISRDIIKKQLKSGLSRYQYSVNTNKQFILKNNNKPIDDTFSSIDNLITTFYKCFPNNRVKTNIYDRKELYKLLDNGHYSISSIMNYINFMSKNKSDFKDIKKVTDLVKHLKEKKVS